MTAVITDEYCAAHGCFEPATHGPYSKHHALMCERHWGMVEKPLRNALETNNNLGARGEFVRALVEAVRAVRSAEESKEAARA